MRNASGHQAKKERQRKKENKTTYNISFIKRVTRKFLEVSGCRLARPRQKDVQKKCAARAMLFFCLLDLFLSFFLLFSLPSPLG